MALEARIRREALMTEIIIALICSATVLTILFVASARARDVIDLSTFPVDTVQECREEVAELSAVVKTFESKLKRLESRVNAKEVPRGR